MQTGLIKRFIEDRGFGFIRPDTGLYDVFFHIKASPAGVPAEEGARVTFEIANDSRSGRTQAVNVRVV